MTAPAVGVIVITAGPAHDLIDALCRAVEQPQAKECAPCIRF
jgi:hypothetical protein